MADGLDAGRSGASFGAAAQADGRGAAAGCGRRRASRCGERDRGQRGQTAVDPEQSRRLGCRRSTGRGASRGAGGRDCLEARGRLCAPLAARRSPRARPSRSDRPGGAPSSAASVSEPGRARCAAPPRSIDLHVQRGGRGLAPLQELGGEKPLHVAGDLRAGLKPSLAEGEALQRDAPSRARSRSARRAACAAPASPSASSSGERRHFGGARDRIVEDRAHGGELGLATEEPPPGEHLPEHDAAARTRRRGGRPPRPRPARATCSSILPLRPPGLVWATRPNARATPKSISFTAALERDEDVLRRDVAVHDAQRPAVAVGERVRVAEPARRLGDDVGGQRRAGRPLLARRPCAAPPKRLALHQLHGQEVLLAVVARPR